MRILILCFCLLAASLVAADQPSSQIASQAAFRDPQALVKEMGRGVNILGYDPFWRDTNAGRFKDEHFQRIHEGGFGNVRVNLHAFRQMDAQNRLPAAWFEKLDWIIDNSLKNKLVVIVDEHDFQAAATNAIAAKARLLAFWQQVAEHCKGRPDTVLFEFLNEPNGQFTADVWNATFQEILGVVRKTNPLRNVVIGPTEWNSIRALDTLKLPEQDRHIIVTVHYYLPMRFTHQGAPWNKGTANLSGIQWGTAAEREAIKKDFDGVQTWATAHKRPIFLGEFGAYDKADMDSRVAYTSAVARQAEAHGWAWAYWQFDSDFVLFKMAQDDWNRPIYQALIPK